MAFVYLGFSIIAAFAVSLSVYASVGSFLLAFLAYAVTGTVVLCCALLSAFLRDRARQAADQAPAFYPAE